MKVGICIPNYNMERYICSAIDSALHQVYDKCTIYILDNNSQDNSWDIIEKYANKFDNIKIFRNDYTISMEENWNKVLRLAKNEDFVNILSSDDKLHPTYISECIKIFEKFRHLGYVYTERRNVVDGNISLSPFFYSHTGIIPKNEEFLVNIKGFHTAPCQLLINNDALKQVNYLSTEYGIVSDMHLTLKLNSKFDVGYIKEKLVDYSLSSGMSNSFDTNKLMVMQFYRLKKNILDNYLPIEFRDDLDTLHTYNKIFCSKFCISKCKQLIIQENRDEVKNFFLLSIFFDNRVTNTELFNYILSNNEYCIKDFEEKIKDKYNFSSLPYALPNQSIILE